MLDTGLFQLPIALLSPLVVDYHWSDPYPLACMALASIALGVIGIHKPLHHGKVIASQW